MSSTTPVWEDRVTDNGLWELRQQDVLRAWAWPTSGGKARWTCGPFNREEVSMDAAVLAATETAFTGTPPPLPSATPDDYDEDPDADEDPIGFVEPEDDPVPDDLLVIDTKQGDQHFNLVPDSTFVIPAAPLDDPDDPHEGPKPCVPPPCEAMNPGGIVPSADSTSWLSQVAAEYVAVPRPTTVNVNATPLDPATIQRMIDSIVTERVSRFDVADEAAEKAIKRFVAEAGATFTNGSDGQPITELKLAPVTFDEFAMACEEVSRLRDRVRGLEADVVTLNNRLVTLEMIRLQSDDAFSRIRERLDAIAANDADRDARMAPAPAPAPALTVTWRPGLRLTTEGCDYLVMCVFGPHMERCVLMRETVFLMENVPYVTGDEFYLSYWTIVHE